MKIFFDDRCLMLLKPDQPFEGQIVVPGSLQELRRMIRDFGRSEDLSVLAVSSPDYKKLKRDVKSLFTIVEAAGGVVENEVGEVLFIHRRGRWDLPKGKIESELKIKNEELKITKTEERKANSEICHCEERSDTAKRRARSKWRKKEAVREVKEETGLKRVKVVRKLKPTWHVYKEKRRMMLKKSYWFEMQAPKEQKLAPQKEEDILYVRWFPREALGVVLENTFGSLREMIEGLRP